MFLVCGEAVIDFFEVRAGEGLAADDAHGPAFQSRPAGSPFNVCVGLARLGRASALLTGLSRDVFGSRLIAAMEREGVEWRLAPRTDRPTILAFVLVGPDGAPDYAFYGERGADIEVTQESLPAALPDSVRAVHVGGFPMAVEPAKSAYAALINREAGRRFISLDPNVRPALMGGMSAFAAHFEALCPQADLVKASREDIGHLYPGTEPAAIAARWRGLGAGAVIITDGLRGAAAWNGAGEAASPASPIAVVDTVGAGDAFMSALLDGAAERGCLAPGALAATPPAALGALVARANAAAGLTCGRRGADPPTAAELGALCRA